MEATVRAITIGADSTAEEKSVARGLTDRGGTFIKVHTAEIEQDSGGKIIKVHTAEIEQDPNKVEGGKGDILISADLTCTAEQKSVARGFLLDP